MISNGRLFCHIKSLVPVFWKLSYIFDNSTRKNSFKLPDEVVYLTEHENKGIAYALNRIMEHSEEDGYQWVITMDQASILTDGLIEAYEHHLDEQELAIICPQVIDSRRLIWKSRKNLKKSM